MSQRRSGLLSGLIAGFIAMLLGAASYAAVETFFYRLSYEARWFGGDPAVVFPAALSFLAGLIIGLAAWTVRARNLFLPMAALLYAVGARTLGSVAGAVGLRWEQGFPATALQEEASRAALALWSVAQTSWQFWATVGAAAVPAFLLTLLRVLRMRRKAAAAETRAEEDQPEPEYRDPFEPVQPPKPTSTAAAVSLFTPRDPDKDAPPATR
ncbi:hypothetical protein FHU36_005042 [Nonomuraea muscovyensis]|uniref:Uncharacterized protein n=1 Tax=Nonomuraea muscovyensis TaxID=1124761 RepID=A0A7X0EXW4_9ACTN|nr:hypothetical protein [Nonomuraea muscovyensis]MBB6348497.1 hypothetical protein [Nonomuraea muscovyensis]